ncbi:nicotinate-nucleotide adenylyltransferase [Caenimonas aquaedulcis]|uniref:Probable nicotinate-nucleotide adenylyltransferase n=1 Tax=Caenimonas aquaedulcis TaxID=2793270 RepID=A0A931H1J8_9BURK|nr:nicotinate-nucleotide adenylyltransferase [Caenimonas aquaedulcis]MBG9386856.1 nicotinate (nicotinamide) nucleotide adenylyltransferase [Caenimonas aquaedulcis]
MTPAGPAPARRVGVFGGAFDPPHVAHVALAAAAIGQLKLDEMRVLPTGQAWHKSNVLTPAPHRLAMTQIAFGELPGVIVDDRELKRPGPTYTIDTLRELMAEQPGAELFLVMGEDQAGAITRWREWQAILGMVTLCMADRPSHAGATPFQVPPEARLRHLEMPAMPESATDIRARAGANEGIDHLVPAGVARYIERHHLYSRT